MAPRIPKESVGVANEPSQSRILGANSVHISPSRYLTLQHASFDRSKIAGLNHLAIIHSLFTLDNQYSVTTKTSQSQSTLNADFGFSSLLYRGCKSSPYMPPSNYFDCLNCTRSILTTSRAGVVRLRCCTKHNANRSSTSIKVNARALYFCMWVYGRSVLQVRPLTPSREVSLSRKAESLDR